MAKSDKSFRVYGKVKEKWVSATDNELLKILEEFDTISTEDYWPHEKEKILVKGIKKFDSEGDLENVSRLRKEWSLLNPAWGINGDITDRLKWISQNINKKPPFWDFENETKEYFEKRLQASLPSLTAARINYYLWALLAHKFIIFSFWYSFCNIFFSAKTFLMSLRSQRALLFEDFQGFF